MITIEKIRKTHKHSKMCCTLYIEGKCLHNKVLHKFAVNGYFKDLEGFYDTQDNEIIEHRWEKVYKS